VPGADDVKPPLVPIGVHCGVLWRAEPRVVADVVVAGTLTTPGLIPHHQNGHYTTMPEPWANTVSVNVVLKDATAYAVRDPPHSVGRQRLFYG
jgi:hypothetical protein